MLKKAERSLLEQLEGPLAVDADTMNAEFIKSLPIKCHDMTSNQKFVHEALTAEHNKEIVESTIKELKGQSWEEVYAVCIARFAKRVLPLISGRVLAQTSPSHAFDEEYVVENARRYARAFNAEGIDNDRLCIKIATTTAGVRAARRLKEEGIPTLGTTLFSLQQAIAASQAGMHAVSMYFNEPMAHTDPSIWPDVEDPATQHPMSARHYQIRQAYDRLTKETSKKQPQMKTASFVSVWEVMAMPELGADHVTLGMSILSDLASYSALPAHKQGTWKKAVKDMDGIDEPHFMWKDWKPPISEDKGKRIADIAKCDPFSKVMTKDQELAGTDVDYLEGDVLDKANEQDEITRLRMAEALKRFSLMEDESRKFIEELQQRL